MNQVFEKVPINNLRFWSPVGSVARFTVLDANRLPLEMFTPSLKGNVPQSLATIKGSALVAGAQSVYVDSDSHLLMAALLDGIEPTLPSFILEQGVNVHAGLADVPVAASTPFNTKANTTIYMAFLGVQATAGTHTITLVSANGTTIGTTAAISWNANANTWAGNIQTALNAVLAGHVVLSIGIAGRVVFSIQSPTGSSIQFGTSNIGSLTSATNVQWLLPLSSLPAQGKSLVASGGAADGDLYFYGCTVAAATLLLERTTNVLASTVVSLPDVTGINGLMVGRLVNVNGPNLSGLVVNL